VRAASFGNVVDDADDGPSRELARNWFSQNWDPEMSLGAWWELLAESGWGYPTWPTEWYGRGLSSSAARAVMEERRRVGALGPAGGVATTLAAPTILTWGTQELKKWFIPEMVRGRQVWCQLFSEPGSGSDLASLRTRAVRDGDEWRITGQKVWSSGAHLADFGILIARSDPDQEKHRGITYFIIDMRQAGIEVRPIREMTGEALFNEVFFDEAHIPDHYRVGDVNEGWRVALTTLGHERSTLGAGSMGSSGGMSGMSVSRPDLSERVGDVASRSGRNAATGRYGGGNGDLLVELAQQYGKLKDPLVRQDIAKVYSLLRIGTFTAGRVQAAAQSGAQPGPEMSVGKLAATRLSRLVRDALPRVLGPAGMLGGPSDVTGGRVEKVVLSSPLWSIGGGTDEIQHNIVGERVLGLPPEPRVDKGVPFRDLRVSGQHSEEE